MNATQKKVLMQAAITVATMALVNRIAVARNFVNG